ncbi:hypothetical protein EV580_6631 [Mycobacterium sp. BK086]|nr:hypothetical protein EV580_6631 [Mycobacterium sp. BK086]
MGRHRQDTLTIRMSFRGDRGRRQDFDHICAISAVDERFTISFVHQNPLEARLVEVASEGVGHALVRLRALAKDVEYSVVSRVLIDAGCLERSLLVFELPKGRREYLLFVSRDVPWHRPVHRELGPLQPLPFDIANTLSQIA